MKKLYKTDRNGNVREWCIEYDDEKYRSISGVVNGAMVYSGWTYPTTKNDGKANSTTVKEQVQAEVDAIYVYKLHQGKYHEYISNIDEGAAFVECMLADTYKESKHNKFPYIAEPKFNGARGLGVDDTNFQTRNGKQHLSCPHILFDIERFQADWPEYILDGELYNHDHANNFEKLMSLIRKTKKITDADFLASKANVYFYVYDVIPPIPMSQIERKQFLEEHVYGKYVSIRKVDWKIVKNKSEANAALAEAMENGYEGLMLRDMNAEYQSGRVKDLIKYKVFKDLEAEVVEVKEGKGTWGGRAKSVTIRFFNEDLNEYVTQDSGIKGDFAFTSALLRDSNILKGTDVTIKFQEYSADGKLMFPVATYWWRTKRDV